jgi:N-acetylglutamate synthase-like GNAT family acetyltransferase
MLPIIETRRENLLISTDPARLDLDAITDMLSRAYWARGRKRELIARTIQHSLAFGVYDSARQIGLARVISDYTTFAYLCDVIIHEDYRGQGIGKWLVETVLAHPDLQNLRRFMLATQDAHGLYAQYGFTPLNDAGRWMEIFNPLAPDDLR